MSKLKNSLTSFDLKIIGILLMVFDHVHQMFYFVGIPLWFTMIGRVVAPIFLFLSAEGFHYTHSRKKYMLTMLIGFWICQILFYGVAAILPNDNVQLMNSIFGTLFLGLCLMWIYEGFFGKKKYVMKATLGFIAFLSTIFLTLFLLTNESIPLAIVKVFIIFVPTILTVEGGAVFAILACLFYIFRENRWLACLPILLLSIVSFIQNPHDIQWMMVFSLIPISLYNGKQGKKEKWFFYIFYPTHIIILYVISTLFFV